MSLSTSDLSHFHIMNQHQHQNDHTHVHGHLPILPPPFMILNENKVNDDSASIANSNKEMDSTSLLSNPGVNVNGAVNLNNIGGINNGTDNHPLASGSTEIKSASPTNNQLYNSSINNMIMLPPLGNPYHYGSSSTPNPTSNTSSSLTNSSNSTTSTSSPNSLLPSTLPPLFKLVLDSTLPLTNYGSSISNNNSNGNNNNNTNPVNDDSNYPLMKSYYSNLNLNKQNNNYLSNPITSPTANQNSSLMEQNNQVNPKKRSISSSSLSPVGHSHYQSGSTQPRKKRECPICHNFFSNLTTHKSIHNKDSKPYSCSTCSRAFKRLNDLIRHEKCHLSKLGEWEFQCPFHQNSCTNSSSSIDSENKNDSCHHTGYFTRCDTYKNHLKAIHFKYPPNTLKNDRFKVSGNCKECGLYFNNVQDWLINHIENNACSKIINFNDYKKK